MSTTTSRQTAPERREAVLTAAAEAFARRGLHGTSTEEIATAAGISQPYLFRLFGTKKALYVATVERCMAETLEIFRAASRGLRGEDALRAMGIAYGELYRFVETVADLPTEAVARWFAAGMLWNVVAAMDLPSNPEPWAVRLMEGCGKD